MTYKLVKAGRSPVYVKNLEHADDFFAEGWRFAGEVTPKKR